MGAAAVELGTRPIARQVETGLCVHGPLVEPTESHPLHHDALKSARLPPGLTIDLTEFGFSKPVTEALEIAFELGRYGEPLFGDEWRLALSKLLQDSVVCDEMIKIASGRVSLSATKQTAALIQVASYAIFQYGNADASRLLEVERIFRIALTPEGFRDEEPPSLAIARLRQLSAFEPVQALLVTRMQGADETAVLAGLALKGTTNEFALQCVRSVLEDTERQRSKAGAIAAAVDNQALEAALIEIAHGQIKADSKDRALAVLALINSKSRASIACVVQALLDPTRDFRDQMDFAERLRPVLSANPELRACIADVFCSTGLLRPALTAATYSTNGDGFFLKMKRTRVFMNGTIFGQTKLACAIALLDSEHAEDAQDFLRHAQRRFDTIATLHLKVLARDRLRAIESPSEVVSDNNNKSSRNPLKFEESVVLARLQNSIERTRLGIRALEQVPFENWHKLAADEKFMQPFDYFRRMLSQCDCMIRMAASICHPDLLADHLEYVRSSDLARGVLKLSVDSIDRTRNDSLVPNDYLDENGQEFVFQVIEACKAFESVCEHSIDETGDIINRVKTLDAFNAGLRALNRAFNAIKHIA